jgi:HSP20 family protein
MADVNVENRSSSTQNQQEGRTGLQRSQSGGTLARSRALDPFGSLFVNPSEFFSNPFAVMRRMSEEMDRTFGRVYGEGGAGNRGSWLPAIEVAERSGQIQVHAELPGLRPEDVKVEITNDALIIQGERRSQHEEGEGQSYRSERRYGQFYREIPLPDGANTEQARAQFRDGVLEISIPVPQQANQRRQIPITGGESSGAGTQTTGTQSGTGSTSAAAAGAGSSSTSSKSTNK